MNLHFHPPLTPRGVLFRHPAIIGTVAALSVAIGVLAAVDGGSVLLVVDEPIQRWVESHRSDGWGTAARLMSRLGSNLVVFSAFAVIVVWSFRRCRTLALTLSIAVLLRSPVEFLLKRLVDRDRPDFLRLVDGAGPSHPSGHVLAAVTLWELLPPLVSVLVRSRTLWWLAVFVSGVLIAGISASRVYLGVHWFTDIVQGLLLGALYLGALEFLFAHHHRNRRCALDAPDDAPRTSTEANRVGRQGRRRTVCVFNRQIGTQPMPPRVQWSTVTGARINAAMSFACEARLELCRVRLQQHGRRQLSEVEPYGGWHALRFDRRDVR